MTDEAKKRAIAGSTIQEKRRAEVEREHHGNQTCKPDPGPQWVKLKCGCGFLMGFKMVTKLYGYDWVGLECLECHRKRHERASAEE